MKKLILAGFMAVALAGVGTAEARTSVHVGLGFWPVFPSYYYAPPVVYAPPPPVVYYQPRVRYVPSGETEVRRFAEDGCRVTEKKIYDADGFLVDRELRRDCREKDRERIEE